MVRKLTGMVLEIQLNRGGTTRNWGGPRNFPTVSIVYHQLMSRPSFFLALLCVCTSVLSAADGRGRINSFLGNDPRLWRMDDRSALPPGHAAAAGPYSVYIGGSKEIQPARIVTDAQGNVFVAGSTVWNTVGWWGGEVTLSDVFVSKIDANGEPVFTTYFGGDGADTAYGLTIDAAGRVYVVGMTSSVNFPTVNAYQKQPSRLPDAFVCVLDANGGFVYSTYLGGLRDETAFAVAADAAGNAYVTGTTSSGDFPWTPGAYQSAPFPSGNALVSPSGAFVSKFSPDGRTLVYSASLRGTRVVCVGGSRCVFAVSRDNGTAIAVDAEGNAYVGGSTNSVDFPVTPGVLQPVCKCDYFSTDAFVSKLNPSGSALVYSTHLGGSVPVDVMRGESVAGLRLDASGHVYVTGSTSSPNFPTTAGAYRGAPGGESTDAMYGFVSELAPDASRLVYSTLLNGKGQVEARGLALDPQGSAWVAGMTTNSDLPVSQGGFTRGEDFLARLNPDGSALAYSTFLPNAFGGKDVALDLAGNAYLLGNAGYVSRMEGNSYRLPAVLGVANAAGDHVTGRISSGELISIFGNGIGPDSPAGLELTPEGKVSTKLSGTEVWIGGLAAPLTYAQKDQINAVTPYYAGQTPQVRIVRDGVTVGEIRLSATAADPGVFRYPPDPATPGAVRHAAALNEDGSVNSAENPAQPGSVVSIFTTGLGATEPLLDDGAVSLENLPKPKLPVSVEIVGPQPEVEVTYAGQAPGLVAGAMQINFRLQGGTIPGPLLLTLKAGEFTSGMFTVNVVP
jgi:uncharacterized protein (TIGR03437 family)